MNKLSPFFAAAILGGLVWYMSAAPDQHKDGQPTNATCGRCSADFHAGWAPVTRCPSCGFSMSTARAKREHGPELIPLPDEAPRLEMPDEPRKPEENRDWSYAWGLAVVPLILFVRRLRRKK